MLIGFVRQIMIAIDTIVYGLLEVLFTLILDLSTFDIFTEATIRRFSERIYLILGIVMVFRIMISLVQLLVDPSKSKDTDKGAIGIYKRTAICLVLIVSIRPIFMLLKQVQEPIIEAIPKVFLGRGTTSSATDTTSNNSTQNQTNIHSSDSEIGKTMANSGRLMAWYSFLPFFMYSDGCTGGSGQGVANLYGVIPDAQVDGGENTISSVAEAGKHVKDKKCGNSEDEDGYDFKYQFLLSTLVGGYLVYVMVSIALAVAIRTIKLSICQIIAPIPIASYIDPKLSEKTFWNWVNTTIKTYVDLFTRLVVVYFILYVFLTLFGSGEDALGFSGMVGRFDGDYVRASLVMIFIIVGLLQFAKDMPKFISKLLGVDEGFGDIAGMFKGEGWKTMAGAAGMVTGVAKTGITATRHAFNTSKFKDQGRSGLSKGLALPFSALNAARHGITAGVHTAARSVNTIPEAKNKGFKDAYSSHYHSGDDISAAVFSKLDTKHQARESNIAENKNIKAAQEERKLYTTDAGKQKRLSEAKDAFTRANNKYTDSRSRYNHAAISNNVAQKELHDAEAASSKAKANLDEATHKSDVLGQYYSAMQQSNRLQNQIDSRISLLNNEKRAGKKVELQNEINHLMEQKRVYADQMEKLKNDNQGKGYTFSNNMVNAEREFNTAKAAIVNQQAIFDAAKNDYDAKAAIAQTRQAEFDNIKQEFTVDKKAAEDAKQVIIDIENDVGVSEKIRELDNKIAEAEERKVHLAAEKASNVAHEFIGQPIAKGQDWISLAEHTRSQKSSYFTGEAFNKIEENISVLKSTGGDDFDYKSKDGKGVIHASFSEMVNAKARLNSPGSDGKVTIPTSNGNVTLTASEFNEYFKAAQKAAGKAYVDRVIGGKIENNTIRLAKEREIQYIYSLAIPQSKKDELVGDINKSYGQYLLTATDRADEWQTKGENLKMHEDLLSGNDSGKK